MSNPLLIALDAALRGSNDLSVPGRVGLDSRSAGIAAATSLNDLLIRHRLSWDEVVVPGSRLAKLCGRLGSAYVAEREAAYDHAVKLIRQRGTTWSQLVRLPSGLGSAQFDPGRPISRPAPTRRGEPVRTTASRDPPAPRSATAQPPESDWITTVQILKEHASWRSESEFELLVTLECSLFAGEPISAADAVWVRDLWWDAELNYPTLEPRQR